MGRAWDSKSGASSSISQAVRSSMGGLGIWLLELTASHCPLSGSVGPRALQQGEGLGQEDREECVHGLPGSQSWHPLRRMPDICCLESSHLPANIQTYRFWMPIPFLPCFKLSRPGVRLFCSKFKVAMQDMHPHNWISKK